MPPGGLQPRVLVALLVLSSGCGGEESEPTPTQLLPTCAEHELALPGGSCIRPGVPLDGCGEGFVHDGVYGCEPILPAEPCPPGLMAVPGEDSCRDVMECGSGTWGDLPVDGTTQYVDGSYAGGDGDGSEAKPWPTVGQAVAAAAPGALIAVAAGSYSEDVLIQHKPVRLWGRCPEQVAIEATGQSVGPCPPTALCILDGADGTEVGGIAIRGAGIGILLSGSENVLVDRVRLHDNATRGIDAENTLGPTSMDLRGSLIEQNREAGLLVLGAYAVVDASVVRANLPRAADMETGRGLNIQSDCASVPAGAECNLGARSNVTLTRSLIEQNHDMGIYVLDSDVTMDASVVRATLPQVVDQEYGLGVLLRPQWSETPNGLQCDPATRSTAVVTRSLIEQNHDFGLVVSGSDLTLDASVVRATLPAASDQMGGRGVSIRIHCAATSTGLKCDPAVRASAIVTRSLIEQNHQNGLVVTGSDAIVDATVVRATWPQASNQVGGHGMVFKLACHDVSGELVCDPASRSTGTVTRSLVEESHEFGLIVAGSDAIVDASVVRTTLPYLPDEWFGDGVALLGGTAPTSATMTNMLIADSTRAGLVSFGAFVSLADTHIRCAAVPLAGEVVHGSDFELADQGGNLCGCPTADGTCKLTTSGLEPPDVLPEGR
ncbi:MAG: hypothetical protein DRI90_15325 [Deltaproteobacteria bacterium]|nr:MAG: hypothetical protein DRI90_15325 [Deltaproteobacteria bacterium]